MVASIPGCLGWIEGVKYNRKWSWLGRFPCLLILGHLGLAHATGVTDVAGVVVSFGAC